MDTDKIMIRIILLDADLQSVWDMLVNPEKTKLYMFNCAAESDWKVGGSLSWHGNFQGYESAEHGTILVSDIEKELKYTSFDPNFGLEDIPINYLHVTYKLRLAEDQTELTVIVENFNTNTERIKHVAAGWDNIVIPAIRNIFS